MFIERRLEAIFNLIPVGVTIPLRVVQWNGRQFNLSTQPTVPVHVPSPSALRYFVPPDLHKLGEALVVGHIRVVGSIHELFRVAETLVSNVTATTRSGFHRLTHHSHNRDRQAIDDTSRPEAWGNCNGYYTFEKSI
jgi:hypothetical protein